MRNRTSITVVKKKKTALIRECFTGHFNICHIPRETSVTNNQNFFVARGRATPRTVKMGDNIVDHMSAIIRRSLAIQIVPAAMKKSIAEMMTSLSPLLSGVVGDWPAGGC